MSDSAAITTLPEQKKELIEECSSSMENLYDVNMKVLKETDQEQKNEFMFNNFNLPETDENNNTSTTKNYEASNSDEEKIPEMMPSFIYNGDGPNNLYETNREYISSTVIKTPDENEKPITFNPNLPEIQYKTNSLNDPEKNETNLQICNEKFDEYTHLSKKHQQLKKYKRRGSQQNKLSDFANLQKDAVCEDRTTNVVLVDFSVSDNQTPIDLHEGNKTSEQTDDTMSTIKIDHTQMSIEKPAKKWKTLPEHATAIMKEWYEAHKDKPYPTEAERIEMARQGNLNENQVKAWFANKRNRSSRSTKPNRPTKRKNSQAKDLPNKIIDMTVTHSDLTKLHSPKSDTEINKSNQLIKIERQEVESVLNTEETNKKNTDELKNLPVKKDSGESHLKILTLINDPIVLVDADSNKRQTNTSAVEKNIMKKEMGSKEMSATSQQKAKRQLKIKPHLQSHQILEHHQENQSILAPHQVHLKNLHNTNSNSNNIHYVPIQPNPVHQYYQIRPNHVGIENNISENIHKTGPFLHSQNFSGFPVDNSVMQSVVRPQMNEENIANLTNQSDQQTFQTHQRPLQHNQHQIHQQQKLQIQLQQFQKQQQIHQQMQQQHQQKISWEQPYMFSSCYYQKKPHQHHQQKPQQYQTNFRNYQDMSNYFNPIETSMQSAQEILPFQNIPTPASAHSASSLTSSFNFNDNLPTFTNSNNTFQTKENLACPLMHSNPYQSQQHYQKNLLQQKQCFNNNCCYIVSGPTTPSQTNPIQSNYYQSISQNNYQSNLPDISYQNSDNNMLINNMSSTSTVNQMQIINNSNLNQILYPVSVSTSNLVNNQQQYQCDTPPPIITKKSNTNTPNSQSNSSKIQSNDETIDKEPIEFNSLNNSSTNINNTANIQMQMHSWSSDSNLSENNNRSTCNVSFPPSNMKLLSNNQQQKVTYIQNSCSSTTPDESLNSTPDLNKNFNIYSNNLMLNKSCSFMNTGSLTDINNNQVTTMNTPNLLKPQQVKLAYNGVNLSNDNNNNVNNTSSLSNNSASSNANINLTKNNSSMYLSGCKSQDTDSQELQTSQAAMSGSEANQKLIEAYDSVPNLNLVNIHPKLMENSPGNNANMSIKLNQIDGNINNINMNSYYYSTGTSQSFCNHEYNSTMPISYQSNSSCSVSGHDENENPKVPFRNNSAFQHYIGSNRSSEYSTEIALKEKHAEQDTRFTDSKNREWCMSHHPRLSNMMMSNSQFRPVSPEIQAEIHSVNQITHGSS